MFIFDLVFNPTFKAFSVHSLPQTETAAAAATQIYTIQYDYGISLIFEVKTKCCYVAITIEINEFEFVCIKLI